jgi:hypothetical protein
VLKRFVGQIGRGTPWVLRIGNPPVDLQGTLEVLVAASGRRINNPPQVHNLPHKGWTVPA